MHNAALAALGLAGEYRLYPAPPLPDGAAALTALAGDLRAGRLHGLNVTIPHKQAVLPLVDSLSETARRIGAVNTLWARSGALQGENTDAPGFLADLQARFGLPVGRALVLGAGGSARAVVYALADAGWRVCVAARRLEQAAGLAASLGGRDARACALEPGALSAEQGVDLIVNTTPLGMAPHTGVSPWPDGLPFPKSAAVYDLVYNPRETRLLADARRAGLAASGGLGMLVEQAALSLELWTGCSAPREVMYNACQG